MDASVISGWYVAATLAGLVAALVAWFADRDIGGHGDYWHWAALALFWPYFVLLVTVLALRQLWRATCHLWRS